MNDEAIVMALEQSFLCLLVFGECSAIKPNRKAKQYADAISAIINNDNCNGKEFDN